jgi:hypothetical protein
MGMRLFGRSFGDSYKYNDQNPNPNPNPLNFIVKRTKRIGDYVIAEINYPDCDNFEGNKILMWDGVDETFIKNLREIDPHFTNNKYSPIARFKPTKEGWDLAVFTATMVMSYK